MKKKKKKKKNIYFSKKSLTSKILSLFNKNPSKKLNYKQISKVFKIKDSRTKTLVTEVLEGLSLSGELNEVKRGSFKLSFLERSVFGEVVSHSKSGVYVVINDSKKEVFVRSENSFFSLKNDVVELNVFKKRKIVEGEIINVIKRNKSTFVGSITVSDSVCFFIPDDSKVYFDIFIPKSKANSSFINKKVLVDIKEWPELQKSPVGKIKSILGEFGDYNTEINSILYQYNLPPSFPKEVIKESEKISSSIPSSEIKSRLDFRDVCTFTIDPDDAKDYDDAISVRTLKNKNYEIGIHIADVSYYVKENSLLDLESFKRSTSVYLVDRVVPMLPEILSNDICSLKPNVDRLSFSVITEIDSNYNIVSYKIKKTIIHSDKRFTYKDSQKIIDDKKGLFKDELILLNNISKKLRKERFKNGSINFEKEEVKFVLDKNNNPTDVYLKTIIDTNHLIEEFMLLSNKIISKEITLNKKNNPFVYRIHDKPNKEKLIILKNIIKDLGYSIDINSQKNLSNSLNYLLKKVKNKPEKNMIESLVIKSMSKAIYSTKNIGHYGLHFNYYSHFTSPIRRYPDLIIHRLIYNYLNNKKSFSEKKLTEICKHCSQKERDSVSAERDSIKYMQSKYLKNKIGKKFKGVISGVTEWGFYVEINKNKCEGLVRMSSIKGDYYIYDPKKHSITGRSKKKKFQLGDSVTIKIEEVNIDKKQIDFSLIS